LSKKAVAFRIASSAVRGVVRLSINLDDQPTLASVEIHHVRPDGMLASHLETALLSL